jgi:hypothetical protein
VKFMEVYSLLTILGSDLFDMPLVQIKNERIPTFAFRYSAINLIFIAY